ncbi:1-acyl-sn-glycerol-3-phosphate acyltransferase [Glaciihabitans arcticus]|uniref:1-acyl-sn-glycerol-3-phosphate acyltransferase n=2 Tax=Glaciihabitans arcticus TaxID=2668039 RepID=A0A4Q9GW15_9MICO|nr:1-acyl-sn-glycerol-3-phosphate acyltransferase [Glaciihabitans arcticus]
MHFLARYKLQGVENVPKTGAFVLSPNHYSEIDPLVMGVAMWKVGRMPRFLAKASIFKLPFLGMLMRKSGQVPVERAGASRNSDPLAAARQIVKNNLAVVIYPEGSLTRDPGLWPMRGKTGAVRMALEAGIPIVPAAHWGTQLVMPRYGKKISLFPRKTITILFGPPVDLSAFAGRPLDNATLTEATAVLMDAITVLFEDLRGEKAPAERWDPIKNNQKETGRFEQ